MLTWSIYSEYSKVKFLAYFLGKTHLLVFLPLLVFYTFLSNPLFYFYLPIPHWFDITFSHFPFPPLILRNFLTSLSTLHPPLLLFKPHPFSLIHSGTWTLVNIRRGRVCLYWICQREFGLRNRKNYPPSVNCSHCTKPSFCQVQVILEPVLALCFHAPSPLRFCRCLPLDSHPTHYLCVCCRWLHCHHCSRSHSLARRDGPWLGMA